MFPLLYTELAAVFVGAVYCNIFLKYRPGVKELVPSCCFTWCLSVQATCKIQTALFREITKNFAVNRRDTFNFCDFEVEIAANSHCFSPANDRRRRGASGNRRPAENRKKNDRRRNEKCKFAFLYPPQRAPKAPVKFRAGGAKFGGERY